MNIKKLIFISIFLLALVTLSAVSAEDNATLNDSILENAHDDISADITSDDSQVLNEYSEDINAKSSSDEIINDNYVEDEDSIKSESPENFTISFYDDYHIYGETNTFGFLMPNDVQNNVSVEIDGNSYDYKIYEINESSLWVWGGDAKTQLGYMVEFSDLSIGDHEVFIHYPGDGRYGECSLVKNITVHDELDYNPDNEYFTIDFYTGNYIYGETNIIAFLMPKDITNNASVQIDWINYDYVECDINDSDKWMWGGDAQTQRGYMVKFSDLKPGNHDLFITYPGDDKYSASSRVTYIKINENSDYNKTITVDGEEAQKMSSKLTAASVTAYYNANKNFVATLKDENGKAIKNAVIKIKINGKIKTLKTDKNGHVKMTVSNLAPKTYPVTVSYADNDNFAKSTVKSKVIIKKAIPKITASKKTFKKSLKTKKYTIVLKANNKVMKNTKVYLKIKGKTYTAKTNKNGKATFKITKLTKKGSYKTIVTYKGNGNYAKKVVTTKITVK